MIQINQLNLRLGHTLEDVKNKAAGLAGKRPEELYDFQIIKRSVDARKKPDIYISYTVRFGCKDEQRILKKKDLRIQPCNIIKYTFPCGGINIMKHRPVIIGMGPAGLFCGYYLAKHGYKPIILERGRDVDSRTRDVLEFWEKGILNTGSNVQFGEGGAGTFSDGKLNTLIKDKDGRNHEVLKTFAECGAPESILYDSKPHIGTDVLRNIVKNMREKIIEWGGEVRFQTFVEDLITENGMISGVSVICTDSSNCAKKTEIIPASTVVLAIGHSARDTFKMLYDKKIPMEAKSFAVGFRIQHPQKMINISQYGFEASEYLSAASYKLTAQTSHKRGVYSFCMCPGGYVVNASSENKRLAVNGMSYSGRNSENANSAIIISVSPNDYGSNHPLAGIEFQRKLEEKAYQAGKGKIPCQYYGEYKAILTDEIADKIDVAVNPQIKGQFCFTDITGILPRELNSAFIEGMEHFGKIIKGFNRPDAILSAVESRTSSPVRIIRNENLESVIKGLYPCGEGAGYAGGITSAAMDGLRIAEHIASFYKPLD